MLNLKYRNFIFAQELVFQGIAGQFQEVMEFALRKYERGRKVNLYELLTFKAFEVKKVDKSELIMLLQTSLKFEEITEDQFEELIVIFDLKNVRKSLIGTKSKMGTTIRFAAQSRFTKEFIQSIKIGENTAKAIADTQGDISGEQKLLMAYALSGTDTEKRIKAFNALDALSQFIVIEFLEHDSIEAAIASIEYFGENFRNMASALDDYMRGEKNGEI